MNQSAKHGIIREHVDVRDGGRVRRLRKRWRRWRELSAAERVLLLRAFVVVAAVRVSLWTLPLGVTRRVAATTGRGIGSHSVERLAWAVAVASRYLPRATCLPQAVALQALLIHAGHESRLEIGVTKDGDRRIEAHAWVTCGGRVVIGGPEVGRYELMAAWET